MKCKMNLIMAIGAVLFFVGAVQAQDVSFDIQLGTDTQSGFTAVTAFPGTDGTVTLSVDTTPNGFRNRGVSAPITGNPYADVLRDLAFWSTGNAITFTFSGLALDMEYSATAFVFDSESGNNGKVINFTTDGGTVTITNNNTDASNSVLALENFRSSGTGTATIVMQCTSGGVSILNGFQLSVIHPAGTVVVIK